MTSACAESPLIHCSAASQEAHLYAHLRGVVPLCAAGIRLRAGIAAGVQGMLVTVRSSMYADYDKSIVPRLPASQARSSRRSLVHVVAVIQLTYTDSGRADERTRTADLLITSDPSGVAGGCPGLQLPHSQAGCSAQGCWVLHRIAFPVVSEWYQEYVNIRVNRCLYSIH